MNMEELNKIAETHFKTIRTQCTFDKIVGSDEIDLEGGTVYIFAGSFICRDYKTRIKIVKLDQNGEIFK